MKKISMLLMSAVFACGIASADIIPTIAGAPTGPDGSGFYTWTWNANVDASSRVVTGSYFTIYDIGGFGPGDVVSQPSGWTSSVALLGTTPSTTLPADDAGTYNVTWTYTGTTAIDGQQTLGAFAIRSTQNVSRLDNYASFSQNQTNNTDQGNVGSTTVPGSRVPEPSTMFLLGGGLTGMGLLARRRKA